MELRRIMKPVALAPMVCGLALTFGHAQADEPSDDALAGSSEVLAVSIISESELGASRGGDTSINSHNTTTETFMTMTASNQGSLTTESYTAGHMSIADDAFGNFAGMHNSVMNTGPLNNLMAGMTVTVVLPD